MLLFFNKREDDIGYLIQKVKKNGKELTERELKDIINNTNNAIKNSGNVIFIHAPTGAGKTFGFLLPTFSSSAQSFSGRSKSIITEPTNAIMAELYDKITEQSVTMEEEIHFDKVTGADKRKDRLWGIPEKLEKNDILLTNIDIISLYVSGFYINSYNRHGGTIKENKLLQWSELFKRISLFIIDEYHAYDEESIGKIIALILLSRATGNNLKFVFSSGTPNQKLIQILQKYGIIPFVMEVETTDDDSNARKISGKLCLTFTNRPLITEKVYVNMEGKAMYMFDHKIDAERFIYRLNKEDIFPMEMTGYYHRSTNKSTKKLDEKLIVATNAAELGININPLISHLEPGPYYENFWQRIGRSGRSGINASIFIHVNTEQIKVLKNLDSKVNLNYRDIMKYITEKISLSPKNFSACYCENHVAGFLYTVFRFSGNCDLRSQVHTLAATVPIMQRYFKIDQFEREIDNDLYLSQEDILDIHSWINNFFINFGYFRGITRNIKIQLPDLKETEDDIVYAKTHYKMEYDEVAKLYVVKDFYEKIQKVNIIYDGITSRRGGRLIAMTNEDFLNRSKFALKIKENIYGIISGSEKPEHYMELLKVLYNQMFVSQKLLKPEEVNAENDDNIFL